MLNLFLDMLKLIIGALIIFLVYSNPTFRSYTLQGLQTLTYFIQDLPEPDEPLGSGGM